MKKKSVIIIILILIIASLSIFFIPDDKKSSSGLVGAYYYPWWKNDDSGSNWWREEIMNDIPFLDTYDSRELSIINQHINWANEYGIDFFCISWWGEGSWEDLTLKDYFLSSDIIDQIRFAILYESSGLLKTNEDNGYINFDEENIEKLISDFEYLAENYFNHSQYLKIDQKPVVFIYNARIFNNNYSEAISHLRSRIEQKGYELYLIGDVVYWHPALMSINLISQFDAITCYNMVAKIPDISTNFVEKVIGKFGEWYLTAKTIGIDFIPNVMPSFDEVNPDSTSPIINMSVEDFYGYCENVKMYSEEPIGVLICSFNEWYEGTQIEKSKLLDDAYLEIIRNCFG